MLKIFNSLTKKIEVFEPLRRARAGLYTCGPTVYDFAHIGNLRTYIFEDVLRRILEFDGYRVKHVMNITDVGHLTSDADTGEDKLEKGARREGKSVWEITDFYTKAFLKDLKELNISVPTKLPKATEHIKDQVALIKKLEKGGYTYETPEAVYFDITKFPRYGKLSGQKLEEKKIGARDGVVADKAKKHPADFALWFKLVGKFKNHTMNWPSPWGQGFPGWHIECSTMSVKYLGQPFDIHAGAVDLILPHHTNEIAQSEAGNKKPLARYWMHGEHLLVDRSKMAKSDGNFYTLADIKKHGFQPLAFRYLVLSAHYRSKLNFSWKSLEGAQNALLNLYNKVSELEGRPTNIITPFLEEFQKDIDTDLNTAKALKVVWQTLKSDATPGQKLATLKKFDEILGLNIIECSKKKAELPQEVSILVRDREDARDSHDFGRADQLRQDIEKMGYLIKDTREGPKVKKKPEKK